jgi:predicted acylesterase/phospholipase RssA
MFGPDSLYNLWYGLDGTSSVMSINIGLPWKMKGFLNFKPLMKMLNGYFDQYKITTPCYAACFDLLTSQMVYKLISGDPDTSSRAIAGSCSIAGIHEPVDYLVDGGHREIAPIRYAVETLNVDEIDVILTSPIEYNGTAFDYWKYFPIIGIALRALDGMIEEIKLNDIELYQDKITVYAPKDSINYSSLIYNTSQIKGMLDLGYRETMAKIRGEK